MLWIQNQQAYIVCLNKHSASFESIFKQGIETSTTAILKNVNSKGSNSTKFKKKGQSEILSLLSYDLSWPLKKDEEKLYNFLTPKISFKYSPNKTKNIKVLFSPSCASFLTHETYQGRGDYFKNLIENLI